MLLIDKESMLYYINVNISKAMAESIYDLI